MEAPMVHFRPLHKLLGLPEAVGCQAMPLKIADSIGPIGFGSDREPRRCGDGFVHRGGVCGALPDYTAAGPDLKGMQ